MFSSLTFCINKTTNRSDVSVTSDNLLKTRLKRLSCLGQLAPGERRNILCSKVHSGRFVSIYLDHNGILSLCEVEVFKCKWSNINFPRLTILVNVTILLVLFFINAFRRKALIFLNLIHFSPVLQSHIMWETI